MSRMEAFSIVLLVVLPVLILLTSLFTKSLGFFFYSIPGAIVPGLTGFLISKRKT
jgi:hypothetical protein